MQPLEPVPLAAIRAAAQRLKGLALRTPLVRLPVDGTPRIWLKLETLQPIGSFKLRGAGNALALADEVARLRRSCRRLIWLNPLLRYAGFEPRAAGVRALLPNVDEHRPVHDLDSLEALGRALTARTSYNGRR